MTRKLREADKNLCEKRYTIIHQTDKTTAYVLINTDEYHGKVSDIQNNNKFRHNTRNVVEVIKRTLSA